MDYHSLHGQEISNFSSSSPHRMPTVSAVQALQDLHSPTARSISTGLKGLDTALHNPDVVTLPEAEGQHVGGISRGQVTEIYGPPGVGKTAFGIQLAVNALRASQGVMWVDAAHPLPGPRLAEVLYSSRSSRGPGQSTLQESLKMNNLLENLVHFTSPTLPHLIALLCYTTPSFPSQNTSLIVIDSLSALVASTYPRNLVITTTVRKPGTTSKNDPQTWASSRKWSVLQYLMSSLQKLAALRNIAVVLLNQSVTKMQSGAGAILVSAISSTAWDAGLAMSIALFRDWGWEGKQVRCARVLKAERIGLGGRVFAFTIESHGLEEVQLADTDAILNVNILTTPSRKRKAVEIRDSEDEDDLDGTDEDYGWAEEDDGELPQPPPQWQGSEDILVLGAEERGEEDEDEDGDEENHEVEENIDNDEEETEESPAPNA